MRLQIAHSKVCKSTLGRACAILTSIIGALHFGLTETIAKKIIKIAQTGVHDAAQLSALAIKELEVR